MQSAAGLVLVALYLAALALVFVALAVLSLLPPPLEALAGYWWEALGIAWGAAQALAVATEAWCRLYRWWVAGVVAAVGMTHTAREFWPAVSWRASLGLSFGNWLNVAVNPLPTYRRDGGWFAVHRPHRSLQILPEAAMWPITRREELVTAGALVVADAGLALAGALYHPAWWAAWAAFRLGDTSCHWIGWLWSRLRGPGTRSSLATAAVGVVLAPLLVTYWWAVLASLGSPLTYAWAWVRARR